MKHKMKKLVAFVLTAVMLLGTLPGQAAAVEGFSAAFSGDYAKVGEPMTVQVQNASSDSVSYSWTVDGVYVGSGDSYTPTENDLMKWIAVTVKSGSDSATAEMFFSELPVVYITPRAVRPSPARNTISMPR